MISLKSHPRLVIIAICSFWVILYLILAQRPQFEEQELHARDWISTGRVARKSPRNPAIVYLGVDESTVTLDPLMSGELEKSRALQIIKAGRPWSRELYALIAERLIGAGAKVVVFDILFPGNREGDDIFRAVLEKYPHRIVIGANFITVHDDHGEGSVSNASPLELPLSLLPQAESDPRIGFVNVNADLDGIVRRLRYRTTKLEYVEGIPPTDNSVELLSLAGRALERAGFGNLVPPGRDKTLIRYSDDFDAQSLYQIFVDDLWAKRFNSGEFFHDKIVLIGASGNVAEDRLITPFGPKLGPWIHLSAINAALNRDFLHESPGWVDFTLILGGAVFAWMLGTFVRQPVLEIALLLGGAAAYVVFAQVLFNYNGTELIMLGPVITFLGSGLTWSAWEQAVDQYEKARVRKTLERYVSKDVVKEVLDNPASYLNTAGGARKKIAVLFSDIRGFTSMTENADEVKLVAQLNEYFTEMVRIVFSHDGTLDKFIGDAVMAHWGGIISHGESRDACHAVSTALQMIRELDRLNAAWKAKGMLELEIGLGVNHGEAICGNLGSEEKLEFSVIGDAVNLASRLESATKAFHVDLLLGPGAAPLVEGRFLLRTVDLLQVKGKSEPVEVFTALGERKDIPEPAWLREYEQGIKHYRKRAFKEAVTCFEKAREANPDDWLIQEYLQRSRQYQSSPPEADWDGVYVMTRK